MKKLFSHSIIAICIGFMTNAFAHTPNAIPYQAVARNSSGGHATGSGVSLSWTMGETFIATLSGGGQLLSQGEQQPEIDLFTGSTATSVCAGSSFAVPYTANGYVDAGNVFTAQLSNASGSFATAVTIGMVTATLSGSINATIPAGTPAGSGYRVRVVSGNPARAAADNGENITVNALVQYYVDADGDGYGSTTTAMLCSDSPPPGYSMNNTDCNDADESAHQLVLYYVDADLDGYGSTTTSMLCSSTAPDGYSTNNTDCNDADESAHQLVQYYLDADLDGYGSTTTAMLCSSTVPLGYSILNSDYNDSDPRIHAQIPDFFASDINGVTHHLYKELAAGNAVVLNFCASWCLPCRSADPKLQQVYQDYCENNGNVKVYGMLFQDNQYGYTDVSEGQQYASNYGLTFPIFTGKNIFDLHLKNARLNNVNSIPSFYVILPNRANPANSIIKILVGDDPDLKNMIKDSLASGGFSVLPEPVITSTGDFCSNLPHSVILSSSYETGNIWSTGDTTKSITVNTSGNYTVTVNNGLCKKIASKNIQFNPIPVAGTASISQTNMCRGGFVTLNYVVPQGFSGNSTVQTYDQSENTWVDLPNKVDAGPIYLSVPQDYPFDTISYRVKVSFGSEGSEGCVAYSNETEVVVNQLEPGLLTSEAAISAIETCPGGSYTISTTTQHSSFQWQYYDARKGWLSSTAANEASVNLIAENPVAGVNGLPGALWRVYIPETPTGCYSASNVVNIAFNPNLFEAAPGIATISNSEICSGTYSVNYAGDTAQGILQLFVDVPDYGPPFWFDYTELMALDSYQIEVGGLPAYSSVNEGPGNKFRIKIPAIGGCTKLSNIVEIAYNSAIQYSINASVSDGVGGSISSAGITTINCGSSAEYSFTPEPGFIIVGVWVDGVYVGYADQYTFYDVSANHSIVVVFSNGNWYFDDVDGDGYGNRFTANSENPPKPGSVTNPNDCDDSDASSNPGSTELCDGKDNNCDGQIDEGFPVVTYYSDVDGDGYGNYAGAIAASCVAPSGFVTNYDDCNDADSTVHPGATELCDGKDNNCDGEIDEGFPSIIYYFDGDGDGYGNPFVNTSVVIEAFKCAGPQGYVANNTDCNDNDAGIHEPVQYYADADQDGYGSTTAAMLCSATAPVGYSTNNTDCNDSDAGIKPVQYYLDADQDGYGSGVTAMLCSATAPAGYSTNNSDCDDSNNTIWRTVGSYPDSDGDGYGAGVLQSVCYGLAIPSGYAANNTDCNDADAAVHEPIQYYVDADGDGYGSTTAEAFCSSTAPTGYVTNSDDGNDDNQAVQGGPGMMIFVRVPSTGNVFTLDGIASSGYIINIKRLIKDLSGFPLADQVLIFNGTQLQDANTLGDYNIQKEATLFLYLPRTWYLDADGDGHYVSTVESNLSPGAGYTDVQGGTFGDCDDTDANVYQMLNLYADVDSDGYESGAGLQPVCMGDFTPFGYSDFTLGVDCNDNNTSINPEAAEICDGIDNNCDGITDSNPLPVISGNTPFCQGSSITMDAGAGYASYSWSTGETTRTISISNTSPVSVTVTNNFGCSATSAIVTPTLNTVSTAPTSITSSVVFATAGTNFTLSVIGGSLGTGASWKWYTSSCGGTLVGTGASISVSQNVNTTYYVRAEGTCNTTACASIIVNSFCGATGIISSGGTTAICAGKTVTLTVIGSLSPGAQWRWDDECDANDANNNCSYSSNSTFTVSLSSTKTYYVRSVGGACGLTACVPFTVTVLAKPATPGTIIGSASVCPSTSVTYNIAAVSGATSYTWTAPSNGTLISPQGSTSMTVSYSSTFTSGTLKVKASNCSGTSSDKSLTISKAAVPATPGTISGASSACAGSTQTYSISAVANASSYTWTLPTGMGFVAGTSITGTSVQVVLASNFASGTISVKANNCAGSSALKTKAITGTALPTQASTISGVSSLCNGSKSNVFSVTAAAGFTFNWTVPSGCSITSGQGTKSIKVTWGTISGTVAVTKNNGCGVSLPSTKAVSSVACREAVEEFVETIDETINLYPNPAVNTATLNFSSAKEGDYQIRVINALGQSVYSSEGKASEGANTIELNLEKLSSGVYIVQLVRNGNRQQVNLIKK